MTTLLLDIGNSRLKWIFVSGDPPAETVLPPAQAIAHGGDPANALAALPLPERPTAIRIANVTGGELGAAIASTLTARFGIAPVFTAVQPEWRGLRVAYADHARLGVDRWLAMLAAWQTTRGAILVASAGTALTVDVVDGDGRHLGGVIAPGLVTAQIATLGATRFAAAGPQTAFTDGLGTDTEACVRQGALHACAGLIERLAARQSQAQCWLTGGDAGVLQSHLAGDWRQAPDLVLQGLGALAA